ncbi:cyclin-dependent kinase inhibitor 1Ca [Pangasianodon hypophthalmus]|uniref:cyclin-dependent kinase inhibitor 1Ca n=1 Tax=Pangasianodon hypophthalmus TaxID=310915 RepID=UPI002306FBB6|nr:cyclin-dependent kinase inhibitor 1Ca [Pangasianodon hypophthalmus]
MANVDVQSMWERHAARRTFPLLSRTKVCRNLFGPVDHEELSCEMKRRLQEISERDQSRWNFNFEENVPLPGHYEWEEIAVSAVPSFYKESVRNGRARAANAEASTEGGCGCKNEAQRSSEAPSPSAEVNQENRSGALNARHHVTPVCRRRKRTSVPDAPTNNTTHITDFFPRRKRSCDSKPAERTSQSSSSTSTSIPAEVTPRKRIR